MYGRASGAGPVVGTSGGSLVNDGHENARNVPYTEDGGRTPGSTARSSPNSGGYGDGSIFATSTGLHHIAKSRAGSSYAGSARGETRDGDERRDADRREPRLAYEAGDASSGNAGNASTGGDDRDEEARRDGDGRYPSSPMRRRSTSVDDKHGTGTGDNAARGRDSNHALSGNRLNGANDASIGNGGNAMHASSETKQAPHGNTGASRRDPKQWVRVEHIYQSTQKAETALAKIRESGSDYLKKPQSFETETQTEIVGLAESNPHAQLKFQASLQVELVELKDLLIASDVKCKALMADKKQLTKDLRGATAARLGVGKNKTVPSDSDTGPDAQTPSQEDMDETVHSLLVMITAERDKAHSLEVHLEKCTADLSDERDARLRARRDFETHKRVTEDEFTTQERKLREATEIIGELRQALLSVMQVREGSVYGGSVVGGSHRGPGGSDGGGSGGSRRSAGGGGGGWGGNQKRATNVDVTLVVRPLTHAQQQRAREESTARAEQAVRQWERKLGERVDGVVAKAVESATRETFGETLGTNDPLVVSIGLDIRGVLAEVVEARLCLLVDEIATVRHRFDSNQNAADRDRAASETSETNNQRPLDKAGAVGTLIHWLAEEDTERNRLREHVRGLRVDLANAETQLEENENCLGKVSATTTSVVSVAAVAAEAAHAIGDEDRFVVGTTSLRDQPPVRDVRNPKDPAPLAPDQFPMKSLKDFDWADLESLAAGVHRQLQRATNTPGFELAWPLLLIAFLLRLQI